MTDSNGNDWEKIDKYIKSLKRRAHKFNDTEGSNTQGKSSILCCPELWMLPVPVHSFHIVLIICITENVLQAGMEKILAERLLEISQKIHADCEIKTYHIPYLPHCIYIEAPGITEIQDLMKFSAYGRLVSCATCISDDINQNFLHGTSVCDVPCPGSWV